MRSVSSGNFKAELLCLRNLACLLPTLSDVLRLDAHDSSAPATSDLGIVVELGFEIRGESLQLLLVLLRDSGESHAGDCFLVDQLAEAGLALDDAVWHVLLAAEGW